MAIDFMDLASRYAQRRFDQATQPFTDPEAYLNNRMMQNYGVDLNGNSAPISTTIKYNTDTGAPETVTTKHEVGTPDYSAGANYSLPTPQAQPLGLSMPTAQPMGMAMPQTMYMAPPAPTAVPDAQAIEEQRRRQLEQLQLQQAQAQTTQQMAEPVGPAVPTVEREAPQPPPMPVTPQAVAQAAAPVALPQFGPGVQVAGGPAGTGLAEATKIATPATAATPNQAPAVEAPPTDEYQQAIVNAHNLTDAKEKRTAMIQALANAKMANNEGAVKLAGRLFADDFKKQQAYEEAVKIADDANPTAQARYLAQRKKDGSIVRAVLLQRLGFNKEASDEMDKLGYGPETSSAEIADGKQYTVFRGADGSVKKAFDTQGNELGGRELSSISAQLLPKQAHLMPSSIGGLMQKTVIGDDGKPTVVTGAVVRDPRNPQSVYFEANGKKYDTTGLSTPSQNVTNVYGAAAAGQFGKQAAETNQPQGPIPAFTGATGAAAAPGVAITGGGQQLNAVQLATQLGLPIESGVRDQARQQQLWDDSVRAGRSGFMANGNPIARPGTSAHQNGMAVDGKNWTPEQKALARANGLVNDVPGDPNHYTLRQPVTGAGTTAAPVVESFDERKKRLALEEARQKEQIQISGKRSESFNKHIDDTITPDAINGDSISATRKQQFELFNRPGVDAGKIFGIANGAGSAPGDQRWTMFRDILLGKVSEPADRIKERAAALGLNREEQSAVAEYAIANADINSKTLKSTAGPGSVSEAEQKINQQRNVDPRDVPMLGGYNAMAQSQFNGDLAKYKGDWSVTSRATNTAELERDWRKEKNKLTQMYADTARDRINYIASMGNTPAAIKEGYKRFPVPTYDANTGEWIKKKPIGSYDR